MNARHFPLIGIGLQNCPLEKNKRSYQAAFGFSRGLTTYNLNEGSFL
jgi:hypothetical protein